MYYHSAEMFSRIDRDLLKERERSGDLWRAQEAARYLGETVHEKSHLIAEEPLQLFHAGEGVAKLDPLDPGDRDYISRISGFYRYPYQAFETE